MKDIKKTIALCPVNRKKKDETRPVQLSQYAGSFRLSISIRRQFTSRPLDHGGRLIKRTNSVSSMTSGMKSIDTGCQKSYLYSMPFGATRVQNKRLRAKACQSGD